MGLTLVPPLQSSDDYGDVNKAANVNSKKKSEAIVPRFSVFSVMHLSQVLVQFGIAPGGEKISSTVIINLRFFPMSPIGNSLELYYCQSLTLHAFLVILCRMHSSHVHSHMNYVRWLY